MLILKAACLVCRPPGLRSHGLQTWRAALRLSTCKSADKLAVLQCHCQLAALCNAYHPQPAHMCLSPDHRAGWWHDACLALQASEKTSGKYREWLVALTDCSKAVIAARGEEAAAKEKVTAAETDLQLFLKEAEDVLGASAAHPKHHRSHRRRRESRAAGEEAAQVCACVLL